MKKSNYVIITCVRNEENVIEDTLKSVINQTVLPNEWLIINDNSEDSTADIIKKYSNKIEWIRYLDNTEVEIQEKGARIASIINTYLSKIEYDNYDFFGKLDGDLILPNDFYEQLLEAFITNPKLGIASGSLIFEGKKEKNIYPDLTRGATKFYRRSCYQEIGGLQLTTGWDTLDNIIAQKKGWNTQILDVWFDHLEEEGASQGFIKKYYNVGKYCGKVPYHSWYFSLKLIYRLGDKPYFLSSLLLIYGYLITRILKRERPFPKEVSEYFRSKQRSLFMNGLKSYLK